MKHLRYTIILQSYKIYIKGGRKAMEKRILGILVVALLIASAVPISGSNIVKTTSSPQSNFVEIQNYDQIDQQQTSFCDHGYGCYDGWAFAQSFIPELGILSQIQLLCWRKDTPGPLKVSIRSSLHGSDLTAVNKLIDIGQDTPKWREFDFEDITVTPGETYYIIWCQQEYGSESSAWFWGFGSDNPYKKGEPWYYDNYYWKSDWKEIYEYPSEFDFCFKTFGENAPPIADAGGPYFGSPGEGIMFNSLSYDIDDEITSYEWDFGDGSKITTTDEVINHIYYSEGTFPVTLTVTDDNGKSDTNTTFAYISPLNPDLACDASFNWVDVSPGSSITDSFTIENIGDPGSKLDWEITEYPSWGIWSFEPEGGDDLTPEKGAITVDITIIAPDVQNRRFDGQVKIVNKGDSNDYEIIQVSLATPKNKAINPLFLRFMENHPHMFPILRYILTL